jgi:hypothetical protein
MKDAQKPDHISLNTLVDHLKEGRFVIPDFQRDFEWEPWDISALMRSIFLDYYIGSLLLWKGKKENFTALTCEPIYAFKGDIQHREHIVLDGQQRLTAMYYAFIAPEAPAPRRQNRFLYFIHIDQLMDESFDEAFDYDWTNRAERTLNNQEEQFKNHIFPLAIVGMGGWTLPNWFQAYEKYWSDRGNDLFVEYARTFGEHVNSIIHQYQIAFIELDRDLALDKVCDIFTQINSRGIRLDIFDLINALIRPKGLKLRHMWKEASKKLDFVETNRMNVYILQVMSIIKQAYCSPNYLYYLLPGQEKRVRGSSGSLQTEILVESTEDFKKLWDQSVNAIKSTIDLLRHPQEFGAVSSHFLPYVSILPALSSLIIEANKLDPPRRFTAMQKIRHWYWASVFTNRYSGSVESTSARDFLALKNWFDSDDQIPELMEEFNDRFISLDFHRETRRGSSNYNGVFNLIIMEGAKDWISGKIPHYEDIDDHHIIPKAWASENYPSNNIDSILNRTPLSSETNRIVIHDRLPNEYLPELKESYGKDTLLAILGTHLISPAAYEILLRKPFAPSDYESFLDERQKSIKNKILELFSQVELDLSPGLSKLNDEIEKIELDLRRIIKDLLNNSYNEIPQHISNAVNPRIESVVRKTPGKTIADFNDLEDFLPFFDLRDLEQTIVSKSLWSNFESLFRSKEMVGMRFNQLSNLRNAIRHSRYVDDITLNDGKAAISWFQEVITNIPVL